MATNFPNGVLSRGVPAEGIDMFSPFGNVFYVDSGHGNANDNNLGTKPTAPMATINAAYVKATAGQGDVIVVAAGHVEDISGNTSLVMNKAGVTVRGLGEGDLRPTLTMTATTSEIIFSGAGIFRNFLIVVTEAGTIDVVVAMTVSAAAHLIDIEFRQTANDAEFVDTVILATGADRAKLHGLVFDSVTNGGAQQSCVNIPAALEGVEIADFYAVGAFVSGAIQNESAAMLNARLSNITIRQLHATQDACIAMHADATGFLIGAQLRAQGVDAAALTGAVVFAKGQFYNVGVVNADGEIASIGPVSDLDVTDNTGPTNSAFLFSDLA